jgi:aryl-alcohol dehydrogenase-like predicted oxidoreductase
MDSDSLSRMRSRTLGEGGPEVTVVGLGTNNFGGRCDLEQTRAVIEAALEEGITLFDTADIYSQGLSESYIGEVLEGRRDRVVLATKFGSEMEGAPDLAPGSRAYIRWAVEGSLERLRTDVIDLYQLHKPDPTTPVAETLEALNELVVEGKVRWIGSSNFDAAMIEEADGIARERGFARFVSAQNHYSFLHREAEDEILPACERLGIGQLPYFPLASGLLTGKYSRGEEAKEGRLAGREIKGEDFDRVDALQRYADERGISLLDVAVGGLLAMPAISSVIAGVGLTVAARALHLGLAASLLLVLAYPLALALLGFYLPAERARLRRLVPILR